MVDKLDKVLTSDDKDTGKTVAFFYINSTGAVNVRKNGDYVSSIQFFPEDGSHNWNVLPLPGYQTVPVSLPPPDYDGS